MCASASQAARQLIELSERGAAWHYEEADGA
ncbi:hypothetical protein C7M52_02820 [Mixta theicola]|nr:hypothetical protein C7M52_02820 [Mixta theicola]